MAEEDAEIALLHQMQAGQENIAWGEGAEGDEDGVLPSNTENSDQQVKEENFSDDQDLRALSPSITGVSPDDDTYDPLSPPPVPAAVLTSARIDSRSSSRASARRPRAIGGFLADDSDEDDVDVPTISSLSTKLNVQLQSQGANGHGSAVSPSPLHISSTSQEQGSAEAINVPVTVPMAAGATATVERGDQLAVQNGSLQESTLLSSSSANAPVSLNMPKARLPLDRVGILEDRIKEDPRGDIDAWLSLISEHRKRNKSDDARSVYERFLKVFPSAVS
jgi:cleavage stimulation factor subunit 3